MTQLPDRRRARRSRSVSFRLTDAEYAHLAHMAATLNLRINALARELALSPTARIRAIPAYRHDPALVQQLHYIGHNLNQITKRLHVTGRVSRYLASLCRRISAIIDEAIAENGGA